MPHHAKIFWLTLTDCRTSCHCEYMCTQHDKFSSFLSRLSLRGCTKSSEYTYTPYWFTWVAKIWEPSTRDVLYVIVTALFPYFLVFSGLSPLLFTITVCMVSNNKLLEIQWVTISYGACMRARVALLTVTTMCGFKPRIKIGSSWNNGEKSCLVSGTETSQCVLLIVFRWLWHL